jgi:hypothetical protein
VTAATLQRGSHGCLDEVNRLRGKLAATAAELDHVTALLAEHLAADPLEQLAELWHAYAIEAYETGRADALAELAAIWPAYPKLPALDRPELAELEARRWELRGEPRTREQFGQPHPHDRAGTDPT